MNEQEQLEKLLLQLRDKHERVIHFQIGDDSFVFRPITPKEYQRIISWYQDPDQMEEAVCELAVVYPTRNSWKDTLAGVLPALHKEIIYASGLTGAEQIEAYLEQGRQSMLQFHEQVINTIAAAYPQYTFEEIETWPMEKLMDRAARAEWKLNMIDGKPIRLQIAKPSEEEVEEPEEPPTIEEIGQQMREEGLDPIMEIGPAPKPPYVEFPLIGGTKIFDHEELLRLVREQIQGPSGR